MMDQTPILRKVLIGSLLGLSLGAMLWVGILIKGATALRHESTGIYTVKVAHTPLTDLQKVKTDRGSVASLQILPNFTWYLLLCGVGGGLLGRAVASLKKVSSTPPS